MKKTGKTAFITWFKQMLGNIYYGWSVKLSNLKRRGYKNYLQSQGMTIGADSWLDEGVYIQHPENITIGKNVHINAYVHFYANYGKIYIADSVTISPECKLIASGYDLCEWMDSGERKHFEDKEIYIGSEVWLGTGATVLPGVKITGKHVVVGGGAVLCKNIDEDNVVVAGVPAKIVKRIAQK